ncbi:MAG: nucleotide exchange factor GrpE [bacterium]
MNSKDKNYTHDAAEETTQNGSVEPEVVVPADEQVVAEEESFKDQFFRMSADFANYRRRMEKERASWVQTGQNAVIQSFLPLLDDIERAFEAAQKVAGADHNHAGVASIVNGLSLVEKNMRKVLSDVGLQEIDCLGDFDPQFHEALMQTAVEGAAQGTIVQVLSKGYSYKGIVVRHAKVSVAA